jgi:hypothetical protein
MKVKRFLLRYDPPGLGLEVEDSGEITSQHVDLPSAQDVTTPARIKQVVEELLEQRSDILSKKKHKSALEKLLARLYTVEMDDEQNTTTDNAPAAESGVKEGDEVVCIHLTGKQQVYNGEIGKLVKVRADKEKYEIEIRKQNEAPETIKVKGVDSFVQLAPEGTALVVGTPVVIRKLRNHVELNGCLGRIVECQEESQRFEVRALESGQLFRVKKENLVPIGVEGRNFAPKDDANTSPRTKGAPGAAGGRPAAAGKEEQLRAGSGYAQPGDIITLHGLKTAQQYNGKAATVLSVDHTRNRYEIRLEDSSVKTVRAENVKLGVP